MENREPSDNGFIIGRAISQLERSALAYFTRNLKPLGIGPGQQAYLLSLQPGETIPQETLAVRLAVDKANVSRALRGLETLDLIERRTGTDGREKLISLTPRGILVRGKVESVAAKWLDYLRGNLTGTEWSMLGSLLERVATNARFRMPETRT